MSDITEASPRGRPVLPSGVLAGAIAANVFAIVTVNYWIYYARAAFIATHPAYVALQPPTISRAISDPAIGVPFAFWVSLSAAALVFGVACIGIINLSFARTIPFASERARKIYIGSAVAGPLAQTGSGIGMYMLSSFRFPDANAMHMVGSYLFFVAQALVIVATLVGCLVLRSSLVTVGRMSLDGLVRPGMLRLRIWVGFSSIGLTVIYIALFMLKHVDAGALNVLLYNFYVLVEPLVISSFLLLLALLQTDILAVLREPKSN